MNDKNDKIKIKALTYALEKISEKCDPISQKKDIDYQHNINEIGKIAYRALNDVKPFGKF